MNNASPFSQSTGNAVHVTNEQFGDDGIFEDEDKSGIDLRYIYTAIRANLLLIGVIIAAALSFAVIATLLQTPRYTATTTIQINDQSGKVFANETDLSQDQDASGWDTERFLQTQMDILDSRGLAERVAQKLRLVGNARFYEAMGVKPPAQGVPQKALRESTIGLLQRGLTSNLPRNSRIAAINFESTEPGMSARIANAFATEFIQANLQRRYDSSAYARDFISGQLADAKVKLEKSERDLNAYARQVGLIRTRDAGVSQDGAGANASSVTTASLLELNSAANQAQATRIAAEQRWLSLSSGSALSSPEVLANPTINTLLSERAKIESQLQQERSKRLEDHPVVQQLRAQLGSINAQIQLIAGNIRSSVKQQYDAARNAEEGLKNQVNALKGSSLAEQDQSVQYNLLAREADTNRALYDGLLQRYKELNAAAGISTSNISIIDSADEPTGPSSPNLAKNITLALLGGVVLAAAVVFLKSQFDDAVRVPEDIESKLGLSLLGVIPKTQETDPAVAMADPKSPISEGYNSLRSSLLYSTANGMPKTVLITSSQPSEGKSTTSWAIAQGIAKLGRTVVLLDVDLRRPTLHRNLGISNEHGMSTVLTAQDAVGDVIQPTDIETLKVITSGPIPPSPTELLSSTRMEQMLDDLSQRFDTVILDSPPVLGLADAPLMSALVEGVVLVVESSRSRRGSLKASMRRLRTMQPNILGAVLTMFDATKSGNRYSEYYGYEYYQYKSKSEDA